MMGKTFDNVFEAQETLFLFLKARTMRTWLKYPAAPPPLNFLTLPYALCIGCRSLWECWHAKSIQTAWKSTSSKRDVKGGPSQQRHRSRGAGADISWKEETLKLPQSYLEELSPDSPAEGLCSLIVDFMEEQGDTVIREDRWKTEMMRSVNDQGKAASKTMKEIVTPVQEAAGAQAKEMAVLTSAVASMQATVSVQVQ